MKVNVIGLGYIGLPTLLMLSKNDIEAIGTDLNIELINILRNKTANFQEKEIEILYHNTNCNFTTKCVKADIYIVCVPTPYIKSTKKIDPSHVADAVKSIVEICPDNAVVAIESTISPGTIDKHIRNLIPKKKNIKLAHVPERIIPGNIVKELVENARTIGADDRSTAETLRKLYSSFCKGKITITDIKTAEMTKVVENTYRDINIAFANELTKICDEAGLNVYEVIRVANEHPRVNILQPGPGVGGHCISVDPWFLVGDYPGLANIILAARKINDSMPEYVLEKVSEVMDANNISELSRVGFYGITYKENVDDIRESPTLQLVECMKKHLAKGAKFYDPFVNKQVLSGQVFDFNNFISSIDILVVMVGHEQIINKQSLLKGKIVIDTRNVLKEINTITL